MTNGGTPISRTPPRGSEAPPAGSDLGTPSEPNPAASGVTTEPLPTAYEYTHPMLKGRSPEEVERIFRLTEQTVREQGGRLTKADAELRKHSEPAPPTTPVASAASAQEFFAEPVKHIQDELARQIAPLREEIATARRELSAPNVRDKLRTEYSDWEQVEPYVDYLLSQQEFPNPHDEGLLKMLYLTGKGLMVQQGISVESGLPPTTPTTAPPTPASTPPVVIPPQHPASTPPAPPPAPSAVATIRELTESEKRLAREQKLTPEQFIKWQEMDMDEVAVADFDLPQEGDGAK